MILHCVLFSKHLYLRNSSIEYISLRFSIVVGIKNYDEFICIYSLINTLEHDERYADD